MKKIGLYICNYNKKEYVLNNIASLEKQTLRNDIDIYVIDNASSDGSAEAIETNFPNVVVLRNETNEGGAGGFYRALIEGEKRGYKYILLADNDVIADEVAVEEMFIFLQKHKEVGMVGAQLFFMDEPEKIWVYGNKLDFLHYKILDGFSGKLINEEMPEYVLCDTVPSCFSLIRTECLSQAGYMPRNNFISWDDIEWCYRFKLAGYEVAAISAAKVWHKTGGKVLTNHFSTYYYNRNKLHFFARYIKEDVIEEYAESLLKDIFTRMYGLAQKNQNNMVTVLMYAFNDFLYDIRGKADEHKILPYDEYRDPLEKYIGNIVACEHVKDVEAYDANKVYVDKWHNVIMSENDFWYFKNFDNAYRNFRMMYYDATVHAIKMIRGKEC